MNLINPLTAAPDEGLVELQARVYHEACQARPVCSHRPRDLAACRRR